MALPFRPLAAVALALAAALSCAQGRTITVTSPIAGDFLGKANTIAFSISGATFKVTVKVKATYLGDPTGKTTVEVQKDFTPDANNKINDSLPINFSEAAP